MNKRKLTHLVGLSVLLCSIWLPAGIEFSKEKISATMDDSIVGVETIEEDEQDTITLEDTDEEAGEPQYSFSETNLKGYVHERILVQIESDKPVREVTVGLPSGTKIEEEALVEGTVVQKVGDEQWKISQEVETTRFELPVSFDQVGDYSIEIFQNKPHQTILVIVIEENKANSTVNQITEAVESIPQFSEQEKYSEVERVDQLDRDSSMPVIFRGWSGIVNGFPSDPNLWEQGAVLLNQLNMDVAQFVRGASGNTAIGTQNNLATNLPIFRILNVGVDRAGRTIHVRITASEVTDMVLSGSTGANPNIRANVGSATTMRGNLNYYFYYSDGTPVESPIYMSISGGNNTTNVFFDETEIYSILTNSNSFSVGRNWTNANLPGRNLVRTSSPSQVLGPFNIIVKNNFTLRVEISGSNAATYNLFRQYGDGIEINNVPPEIAGQIVEEDFISQYKVTQRFEEFIEGDFEMELTVPEILQLEAPTITGLQDQDGNPIDGATIRYEDGKMFLGLSRAEVQDKLGGKSMEFFLNYAINKEKEPETYLEEDGYLHIPLTASSSLVPEETTSGTAKTWARPWGNPVPQTVSEGDSTEHLDATVFVENLENKLTEDEPFVVGFGEEKSFDTIGNETVDIVIESMISGIQATIEVPVTVLEKRGPVDPLNPEVEVSPENPPHIPENQGLISFDFASQFDFGEQTISLKEHTYYAKPQRLLTEDGLVDEAAQRPNYIQISDRRSGEEKTNWRVSVLQEEQFTSEKQELQGAQLQFSNQQLVTAGSGSRPDLVITTPVSLIPGVTQILVSTKQDNEGQGTWLYRFGDVETMGESVGLNVPKLTVPEVGKYSTKLTWELSAVPGN